MKKNTCSKAGYVALSLLAVAVSAASRVIAEGSKTLDEVVVTAEHKAENLQDAELAVTALTSQNIEDMGISSGADLANAAPNLVINSYQGGRSGVSIAMRGISQNETLATYDPAVGVYIDDVLLSKNVGALIDVLDLERIEILRGPQGTLYGRNTMGGAVNFVTKKPSDKFEGRLVTTLGKYNQRDVKGMLNVPLASADSAVGLLALRVTGGILKRDGLTDNDYTGPSPYALPVTYNTDLFGWDSSLLKRNGELESKDRKVAMAHLQWEPMDALKVLYTHDMTDIDETPNTPWLNNTNPAIPIGRQLAPYAIGRTDRPNSISVNGPHLAQTEVTGNSLQIDYEFSDALTFRSITAKREMENYGVADSDGSPLSIFQTIDTNIADSFTQEFRFLGAIDKFDYAVGLFYMDEDGSVDQRIDVVNRPERTRAKFANTNWAAFGQGTYNIDERWSLTAGFRYTEEERELSKIFFARGSTAPQDFGKAKKDFDNFSPMISVGYKVTEDILSYFKVSTGFQSGGLNVRDTNIVNFQQGFESEKLLNYELGVKADIIDRIRINSAFWFSDYTDKRVNQFDPNTLGNTVRNAGVVQIYGLELELLAQLTDSLQLGFNYGYQKPEYKEYDAPNPACATNPGCDPQILDLSDTTNFVYTPENTAGANLTYENPLGFAVLRSRLDWSWKEGYSFNSTQPERNSQKSHQIVNASITLDDILGPVGTSLQVSVWGKNLLNESYYYNGVNVYDTFGFDINTFAEPRTYGIDFGIRF